MVTIVIKDNTVSKEDILAYIEREHIEGEYEVITREEYEKRQSSVPVFEFQLSPSYRMIDLHSQVIAEKRRQRDYQRQQQKYARRFFNAKMKRK